MYASLVYFLYWYFYLFSNTAPSSPRNLTLRVESDTMISVSWLPPEHKNGKIIQYRIQLRELGMNLSERIAKVSGGASFTLVNLLKPYTNYIFRIRACTSAGCGNFSEKETARTHEGRMYISLLQYYTINFVFF